MKPWKISNQTACGKDTLSILWYVIIIQSNKKGCHMLKDFRNSSRNGAKRAKHLREQLINNDAVMGAKCNA